MKSQYSLTIKEVETLANTYANASGETGRVNTTYLRVLVAGMQSILGNKKRPGRVPLESQREVLDDISRKYYAAVLRGITTPELAADPTLEQYELSQRARERNRRSTFARSAKSTLRSFIDSGGDIRTLDVDTVTRDPLLTMVREARGHSESSYKLDKYKNAALRLIAVEFKRDPAAARANLAAMVETLSERLDSMNNGNRASGIHVMPADRDEPSTSITQVLRTIPAIRRQAPAHA